MKPVQPSQLDFSLHGVHLRLDSSHAAFIQTTGQALADLLPAETSQKASRLVPVQIETHLHWETDPPGEWQEPGSRRWGRRLMQRGERILLSEVLPLSGLQIAAAWENQCLCVDAYYRRPAGWRSLPQFLLGEARLHAALSYYLVYFPLLHYLEQIRNLHPLHAAAVTHPEGSFLLAGLPGSGKSTFSVSFLEDSRAQLLSDNLVLYDKEQVYSLPETIHLSGDSLGRLSAPAVRRLEAAGQKHSYERETYHLDKEARASFARPAALFFLGLADQGALRPLPTALAVDRLLSLDGMAKEIIAYQQFAAALELVAPLGSQTTRRHAALQSLLQKAACYELWLESGADLRQARKLVNDVLAAQIGG